MFLSGSCLRVGREGAAARVVYLIRSGPAVEIGMIFKGRLVDSVVLRLEELRKSDLVCRGFFTKLYKSLVEPGR